MDVSPNITRIAKVAGIICLPISGVLVGIVGVFFWLSLTEPPPAANNQATSAWEAPSPLNIIRTGSLYLDSFKSAALYDTYENAQALLHARTAQTEGAEFARVTPKKPLLAQIADSMRIVPEAQASTPASTATPADSKTKNTKNGKSAKEATSKSAKPIVAQKVEPAPVNAAAAPVAIAAAPVQPPARTVAASAPTAAHGASAGKNAEDAFPDTFKAGSLGQLTQLRAELEQLKMQVTIEETRSKLKQLRGTTPSNAHMPSLEFPPIGMPSGAGSGNVRILSIQSVNGKYTATVGTAQGPKIVSVNDSINGNRVVSITRNSVVINRGQGNETLTIQE